MAVVVAELVDRSMSAAADVTDVADVAASFLSPPFLLLSSVSSDAAAADVVALF